VQKRLTIYGRPQIEQEARRRGHSGYLSYPYVTGHFIIEDWDFDDTFWEHWRALASDDDRVWTRVINCILSQQEHYWTRAKAARLLQVATTDKTRSMTFDPVLPTWVLRLRDLPCMLDTHGVPHKMSNHSSTAASMARSSAHSSICLVFALPPPVRIDCSTVCARCRKQKPRRFTRLRSGIAGSTRWWTPARRLIFRTSDRPFGLRSSF
jgi:hypothetical protein